MKILGISAHYHDSAAALLVDSVPVCAVQEERLSRRKNDAGFPIGVALNGLACSRLRPMIGSWSAGLRSSRGRRRS